MTTPPTIRAATYRAVTYRRVSSLEQLGGTSPETQLERGEAIIAENGWQNVGDFFDPGVSGAEASRRELNRFFEMCRAGLVDVVVVGDLSRLSRDLRNSLNFEHELQQLGVQVIDADNPHASEEARQIGYMLAAWHRKQITRNTHRGILAVAEQGYWPGGRPPFGWRIVPAPDNPRRKIAILDEAEATTIRKAVDLLVDEGLSCWETAQRLNVEGYLPRHSARWSNVSLRWILKRTYFTGEWVFRKAGREITVCGPEILAAERMQQLRRALQATSTIRPDNRVYPLSGRLFGACDVPFNGLYQNEYGHWNKRRYRCRHNNIRWDGTGVRCHCRMVDADWLDQTVWSKVSELLRDPQRLLELARQYLDLRGAQVQTEARELSNLDRRIAAAKRKRTNLALAAAATGPEAVADALAEITAEIETLEQRQAQARAWAQANAERAALVRDLEAFAATARERLDDPPTLEEMREAYTKFDIRVQIIGDHFESQRAGLPAYRPNLRISGVIPFEADRVGSESIQLWNDIQTIWASG